MFHSFLKVFIYEDSFKPQLKAQLYHFKLSQVQSLHEKMSKYEYFFRSYFPLFGLNTQIYSVNLLIQYEYKKYRPEKTPYSDTVHKALSRTIIPQSD